MKLIPKLILLMLGIFMLGTASAGIPSTQVSPTEKNQGDTEYLFIQTAKIGNMQKVPNQNNTYVITLRETDPWITYFSNVPKRITGFMHIDDFSRLLAAETKTKYKAGLNSGIIALINSEANNSREKMVRYVLSIKDPQYDPDTQSVTFTAHIVPGIQKNAIPSNINFIHASLFIDSICASCGAEGF